MAAVSQFLGIPYCAASPADTFRQFDAYAVQGSERKPLLVFVHGGAWRSEDKIDHADLAQRLALATNCPVFVPNYRLTSKTGSEFHHPAHAGDILQFLEFLLIWKPDTPELASAMDSRSVYLIGHSCSAHMLTAIILDSDFITPSLAPSPSLLQAVKAIMLSEGIYDLDLLLDRFPNYGAWFIEEAFGALQSYSQYDVNHYRLRDSDNHAASWLIIHSKEDKLVDVGQSEAMYAHLCRLYGKRADTLVSLNTDKLNAGHDEILRGDQVYIDIIQTFVRHVVGVLQRQEESAVPN